MCLFVPPTGPYMAEGRGRWAGPSMPVRRLAAMMSDSGWEWAEPQQVNTLRLVFVKRFMSTLVTCLSVRPVFPVKDAREKLAQKDARFRIRGRGGSAGAVQDARQTINSRKQQQTPAVAPVQPSPVKPAATGIPHIHIHNPAPSARVGVALQPGGGITKVVDARDRLSLKRSVPTSSNQMAASMKITKTIQVSAVCLTGGCYSNTGD